MKIGFLGLGGMGAGMAANLLKAGHQLCVWNRSPALAEPLLAQGATLAAEPQQAFDADVVVTMLADDAATRSVVLDSGAEVTFPLNSDIELIAGKLKALVERVAVRDLYDTSRIAAI